MEYICFVLDDCGVVDRWRLSCRGRGADAVDAREGKGREGGVSSRRCQVCSVGMECTFDGVGAKGEGGRLERGQKKLGESEDMDKARCKVGAVCWCIVVLTGVERRRMARHLS